MSIVNSQIRCAILNNTMQIYNVFEKNSSNY